MQVLHPSPPAFQREEVAEHLPLPPVGRIFYLPPMPVIKPVVVKDPMLAVCTAGQEIISRFDVPWPSDVDLFPLQRHDGMPVVTGEVTTSDFKEAFEPQMPIRRCTHMSKQPPWWISTCISWVLVTLGYFLQTWAFG